MNSRPDRDTFYMSIATLVSLRSTCLRAQVGAVLVRDNRVLSIGYNGSPRGFRHCTPESCGPHVDHCRATIHAELNVILSAAAHGVSATWATLYTTHFPCLDCAYALINSGVKRVVYWQDYNNNQSRETLQLAQIETWWVEPLSWMRLLTQEEISWTDVPILQDSSMLTEPEEQPKP